MSEYTQGPWIIHPDYKKDSNFQVHSANGEPVIHGCGCCGSPWCKPEDARLIAAAPQLLEALKALCECNSLNQNLWDNARHAIAAAEGKS